MREALRGCGTRGLSRNCGSDEFDEIGRRGIRVEEQFSRRFATPAQSLSNKIVARTEGYTYDTQVWALSLIQGPFYVARAKP
jgi:hypothetical protein